MFASTRVLSRVVPLVVLFHARGMAAPADEAPVTIVENRDSFVLANGLVTARISKKSGQLDSVQYRDLDLLRGGRGYWSFSGSGDRMSGLPSATVRTDPTANDGARGEVAVDFPYDESRDGLPCDVSLRYALGRGEHWIYIYAVWNHRAEYPAFRIGEARYAIKLNPDIFDYMTVDANRRRVMPTGEDWDRGTPLNLKEVRRMNTGLHAGEVEHKYDYSAVLSETPAYGWSSTREKVGLWIVNPNMEYMAGGPTKVELTGHLDVNPGGLPTLLNMWLGSHYGGSSLGVARGEDWSKCIGPFLIYANAGEDHEAMWNDALTRAGEESKAWPYGWVSESEYPQKAGRGTVVGRLELRDPGVPDVRLRHAQVGLTAPDYRTRGGTVDWQRDAKFYHFWTHADVDGRFSIPKIRPGTYTLHAISNGVLGEFVRPDVTVKAGDQLDLGTLTWEPERLGRQLWEIGVPDRTAAEFHHGDDYWHWGLYLQYAQEFPDDVNFIIGKSDPRRDWNYAQPPRLSSDGRRTDDSTWRITFELDEVPHGPLTLRMAFCGARRGGRVSVAVNGEPAGDTGALPESSVMHRDGIRGYWFERRVTFSPSLLKVGTNVVALRSHTQAWHQGVLYDYLRLEAAEKTNPPSTAGR